nr:ATP-binding cassette domain-containing protein [Planobispora longispora]
MHVVHTARSGGLLRRDRVHALTDATVSVGRGEILGVVGESGCGKSTLAKVVVGLQPPTSGTVRFRGEDLWAMPARTRRESFGSAVAMVFQDASTALNPGCPYGASCATRWTCTGGERTAARGAGARAARPGRAARSCRRRAARRALRGQRQRVAVARALALEPDVIVADEPTSALDVSVRAQVLNLLVDLRARLGLGLVFISHDIQTVRYLADRIAVMYLGRVVEEGPAADVGGAARHPYTRALFSATPSLLGGSERIVLTGPVPSATHPPSGCPFRTRCWKATDECATEFPHAAQADPAATPGTASTRRPRVTVGIARPDSPHDSSQNPDLPGKSRQGAFCERP